MFEKKYPYGAVTFMAQLCNWKARQAQSSDFPGLIVRRKGMRFGAYAAAAAAAARAARKSRSLIQFGAHWEKSRKPPRRRRRRRCRGEEDLRWPGGGAPFGERKGDDNFRGPPIGKLTGGVTSVFPYVEKNLFSLYAQNLHHAAVLFEAASTSNVNTIVLPSPLAVVLTTLSCR